MAGGSGVRSAGAGGVACAARYREFAPCAALRPYLSLLYTFSVPALEGDRAGPGLVREIRFGPGDRYSSPLFADGNASMVYTFGAGYRIEGLWEPGRTRPHGHLIGPMTRARGASVGSRIQQVGAYFRAAQTRAFMRVPGVELADSVTALNDLWGPAAAQIEELLAEAGSDARRIAALESALLARLNPGPGPLRLTGIADWVAGSIGRSGGAVRIQDLADAAGISRQHLTRVFRREVGVSPKLYAQLVRFRAALVHAGSGRHRDWAGVAAGAGYADQSHLIAEVKRFSGMAPGELVRERRFHPFLEDPEPRPG